jgi:hypothetical protein
MRIIAATRDYPYIFSGSQKSLTWLTHLFPHLHIHSNLPMQSPVLKDYIFLVLSLNISYELNLF